MDQKPKSAESACIDCVHYYITWDKDFPFGCKAMGFKSRSAPHRLTKQLSGLGCLSFVKKP